MADKTKLLKELDEADMPEILVMLNNYTVNNAHEARRIVEEYLKNNFERKK